MQSVNCSVDLDAESLLGFKTIIQKEGKQLLNLLKASRSGNEKRTYFLY